MSDDINGKLAKLWDMRAATLLECGKLVANNRLLSDRLSDKASAYSQCARDLESPPEKLLENLGLW